LDTAYRKYIYTEQLLKRAVHLIKTR